VASLKEARPQSARLKLTAPRNSAP
jgi:hypothetical protein